MYTVEQILKSNIVSIPLLQKIQALYGLDLTRVRISVSQNPDIDPELIDIYYLSDSDSLIPIVFVETEDHRYKAYYHDDAKQSSTVKNKIKVLKNNNIPIESLNKENLRPIEELMPSNITRSSSGTNNMAAFAKTGILLMVSILASILLASIILLFK